MQCFLIFHILCYFPMMGRKNEPKWFQTDCWSCFQEADAINKTVNLVNPLELLATAGSVGLCNKYPTAHLQHLFFAQGFQPNLGLLLLCQLKQKLFHLKLSVRSPMSCSEGRFLLLGAGMPILPSLSRGSLLLGPFPVGFL